LKINNFLVGIFSIFLLAGVSVTGFVNAQVVNTSCIVLDFEGVGNLKPVGTMQTVLGDASFSITTLGLVDGDAGGNGNFANEPSPDTVVTGSNVPIISMMLENPVIEVSWYYSSPLETAVRIYDSNDNLIVPQINQDATPLGIGDIEGEVYGTWIADYFEAGSSIIKKVEFEGFVNTALWDNIGFCTHQKAVAGELMPLNTTTLFVSGLTSSTIWMVPTILGITVVGAYYVKFKKN
jgi:hypothetical protein